MSLTGLPVEVSVLQLTEMTRSLFQHLSRATYADLTPLIDAREHCNLPAFR